TTRSAEFELEDNLLLLTGNNAPEARRIGARGLLAVDSEESLQHLVDVLGHDEDPAAQLAVCQELQTRDVPPSVLIEPVLRLLDSSRKDVGDAAGRAIGQFSRMEVVPRLGAVASGRGPTGNGRLAAVAALGRMGMTHESIDALVALLGDTDTTIQSGGLSAMEHATGLTWISADEAGRWWESNRGRDMAALLAERDQRRERAMQAVEVRMNELTRRLVDLYRADYLQRPDPDKTAVLLNLLADTEGPIRALGLEL